MKRVLQALALVMILAGTMLAQQETSPDIYPDHAPVTQQQVAQKKQPATKKAVAAKKQTTRKATLVAAKTPIKPATTRSN